MRSQCPFTMLFVVGVLIQQAAVFEGQAQVETFEDGNDDGWTRYDPLEPFGGGATYSFPPVQTPFGLDYRYRIEANPSPNPDIFGFARAGTFRSALPNAAGAVWQIYGWDDSANQTFGGFVGVGYGANDTLDGYGFTYSTAGSLDLLRLDEGVPTFLATTPISLDPSLTYRFTFVTSSGGGLGLTGLAGRLYEGPNFVAPIATLETLVPFFPNAASGLYLFSNEPNGGIGATFDNFGVRLVPEPSTLSLLALGGTAGLWFAFRRRLNSR